MAEQVLRGKNGSLPSPTALTVGDEIIWTSDTGRTLSGLMVGDVVAEKKSISIKWEFLTESEFLKIRNSMVAGFFTFSFHDDGTELTITSYRSTLSKDYLGYYGGTHYYRTVTVDITQR